jgi:hypothetical protein
LIFALVVRVRVAYFHYIIKIERIIVIIAQFLSQKKGGQNQNKRWDKKGVANFPLYY